MKKVLVLLFVGIAGLGALSFSRSESARAINDTPSNRFTKMFSAEAEENSLSEIAKTQKQVVQGKLDTLTNGKYQEQEEDSQEILINQIIELRKENAMLREIAKDHPTPEVETFEKEKNFLLDQLAKAKIAIKTLERETQDRSLLTHELEEEKQSSNRTLVTLKNQLRETTEKLEKVQEQLGKIRAEFELQKSSHEAKDTQIAKFEKTVTELQKSNQEFRKKAEDLETLKKAHEELAKNHSMLKTKSKELYEQKQRLDETVATLKKQGEVSAKDFETLRSEYGNLKKNEEKLTSDLVQKDRLLNQMEALQKANVELKNQMLEREEEIKVLNAQYGKGSPKNNKGQSTIPTVSERNARNLQTTSGQAPVNTDVMIIEITAAKASLRNGPGTEHGVQMELSKGARLTVEAKQGEWYRVLTPTGGRAYISSDVARELKNSLPPVSSSTPQGQDTPEAAFKRLTEGMKK